MKLSSPLSILLVSFVLHEIKGQECSGILTFDKLTDTTLNGVPQEILFKQEGSPITAECNNRCRSKDDCSAYNVNYDTGTCFSLKSNSSGRREFLSMSTERINYFEKTCLQGAGCEKAWLFERVPGFDLIGFDSKVIEDISSRIQCQEICLDELDLPCRSAIYDYNKRVCRLSRQSRRTQPNAYRATNLDLDYLENQCSSESKSEVKCEYQENVDKDIGFADLTFKTNTRQGCASRCDTMSAFNCRSFTYNSATSDCSLSGDDSLSTGLTRLESRPGYNFYQKSPCLDLSLICTADTMELTLNNEEGFNGRIYAINGARNCSVKGLGKKETRLAFPYSATDPQSSCGVERNSDGAFFTSIVVQDHPVIQQRGDQVITLYCFFRAGEKVVTDSYEVITEPADPRRPNVLPNFSSSILNGTAPTPLVELRIVDAQGDDITGTRLGQTLFLRIELRGDSIFDIFARNLKAQSGIDDEEILLIDDRGCPIDSVFTGLTKEGDSGILMGRFEAFKFSDTSIVNFQVNVQFCEEKCNPVECENGEQSYGRRKKRSSFNTDWNINSNFIPLSNSSYKRLVYDKNLKQEVIIEDKPLRKQIYVDTGIAVASFNHHRLDVGKPGVFVHGEYNEEDVVCTTWTVVIGVSSSIIFLQFCILLVCVLCIYASQRSAYIDGTDSLVDSSQSTNRSTIIKEGERKKTYFRSPVEENSEKALKSLRTKLRD